MKDIDHKQFFTVLLLSVIILFFWNYSFIYPLKILTVFFHELSHGFMAILTGGRIVEIQIVSQQGGHCITAGGSRFLITTAGYLGSLFIGGMILYISSKSSLDKTFTIVIGVFLLLCSLFWVRPFFSFGFVFCTVISILLWVYGIYLNAKMNEYLLKIIGLTSCLYVFGDIKSDIIDRPELRSDARILSEITGIPTLFWGFLWMILAFFLGILFLYLSCKKSQEGFMEKIENE